MKTRKRQKSRRRAVPRNTLPKAFNAAGSASEQLVIAANGNVHPLVGSANVLRRLVAQWRLLAQMRGQPMPKWKREAVKPALDVLESILHEQVKHADAALSDAAIEAVCKGDAKGFRELAASLEKPAIVADPLRLSLARLKWKRRRKVLTARDVAKIVGYAGDLRVLRRNLGAMKFPVRKQGRS